MDLNRDLRGGYALLSRFRSELMGLAILWVMLFHAYQLKFNVLLLDSIRALGFAGVDVFILLSGLGLYVSFSKRGHEPFFRYFARRCVRILPAYWLVVGAYSLWLVLRGRIGLSVLLWNLSTLHYWFHIPGSFNWYVPAILLFYLLAPLLAKGLRGCRWPALPVLLAFPLSYGLYRFSVLYGFHYMADVIYRIPAFLLGLLVGRYVTEGKKLTAAQGTGWLVLYACGSVLTAVSAGGILYIPTCYPIGLGLTAGCLLTAYLLSLLHRGRENKALRALGESSLEIYLLNVIVTREFSLLQPIFGVDDRHFVCYGILFVLNIVLGLLLHRLMARLPLTFPRKSSRMGAA